MAGQSVSKTFVDNLRAQERGYTGRAQQMTARKSTAYQSRIEQASKNQGKTIKSLGQSQFERDFARAFARPNGTIRSSDEAEEHDPIAYGRILLNAGRLTTSQFYRYFDPMRTTPASELFYGKGEVDDADEL